MREGFQEETERDGGLPFPGSEGSVWTWVLALWGCWGPLAW